MPSISQINTNDGGVVMTGYQTSMKKQSSENEHFQNGIRNHKRNFDATENMLNSENHIQMTTNGNGIYANGNGVHHNGNGVTHDDIDSVNGNGTHYPLMNGNANGMVAEKIEKVITF